MPPAEATKLFAKLKLDTTSPKPIATSPFSQKRSPDYDVDDAMLGAVKAPLVIQRSPLLAPDALASDRYALHDVQEGVVQNYHDVDHSEPQNIPGRVGRTSQEDSSTGSRRSSISFASNVTVDDGNRIPIEEPIFKHETKSKHRGRSILQEIHMAENKSRAHSESRRDEYDPRTGQRLDHKFKDPHGYHTGIMRHPLLQTTVDDLARRPEITDERVASLTSETTASPKSDEARTPSDYETMNPRPVDVYSPPGSGASSSPMNRGTNQRSKSYRELGSMRRPSRRSSARSANNSKSPAGQFLSMWAKEDNAVAMEPDEEGQEIGDHSGYIIGRQIGVGGFSVVKEVFSFENGQKTRQAVKIVRKQVQGKAEHENEKVQTEFEHEVSIWRYLSHRYILPLLAVYETPFATFCITKLNQGGTLFDLIHSRRKAGQGGLPSHLAKRYVYQMASAIRYLHEDIRVVHRDIKIENVLIDMSGANSAEEGGNALLCDFGMADYIHNEHRQDAEPFDQELHIGPSHTSTSVTGSLRYAAPELLQSPHQLYSPAVDMWAFGNVVYALLTARLAFADPFEPRVVMQIMRGEWEAAPLYKSPAVKGISTDPVDLVKGCLEKDPNKRWTISQVLDSPWLAGCAEQFEEAEADWQ